MCLGTAYIWGIFQTFLIKTEKTPDALFSWPATHGTWAYALLLFVLTFGSVFGGNLQKKLKPNIVIILAGIVMGVGFFLAQFTTQSTPWLLWLSYGVLGGFGMGMAYTTVIATCQKWFPDRRGLVTGIIVAALGAGSVVFSQFAAKIIKMPDIGVLKTFAILGIVFIIVTFIGSFFIKSPPEGFKPEGWTPPAPKDGIIAQSFTALEVLKTPQFYMVTFALMFATAAGSMMIPMAKVLGLNRGLTAEAATLGVTIIGGFNAFGRLFWGWVSDKFGRKNTILVLLLVAGASIVIVAFVKAYLVLVFIAIIGFSYGGFLGVFPALTADFWGTKHVATIYGMVLVGFGIGAAASSFTVAKLSATKSFTAAFIIAGIAAVVGLVIVSLLKSPKLKDEKAN
jgi:MFS transporter, OFA family, oxalate/formate antiporter